MIVDMKRKLKSYLAFTSVPYRLVGLLLIPCLLLALCLGMLRGENNGGYPQIVAYAYMVFCEILADHWMLGGCLSDGGKDLAYFRTSRRGAELVKNAVIMDLAKHFLYCVIYAGAFWILTGQACDIVNGLAAYCIVVGVLNGSRHIEGFQILIFIAFLAQLAMFAVGIMHFWLFWLGVAEEGVLALLLAALYGAAAVAVSVVTVRRITRRVV